MHKSKHNYEWPSQDDVVAKSTTLAGRVKVDASGQSRGFRYLEEEGSSSKNLVDSLLVFIVFSISMRYYVDD